MRKLAAILLLTVLLLTVGIQIRASDSPITVVPTHPHNPAGYR